MEKDTTQMNLTSFVKMNVLKNNIKFLKKESNYDRNGQVYAS